MPPTNDAPPSAELQPVSVETYNQMPLVQRARAIAAPLVAQRTLPTGESALAHADGTHSILADMDSSEAMQAIPYLVAVCAELSKPLDVLSQAVPPDLAQASVDANQLLQRQHRTARAHSAQGAALSSGQIELVRKMLLASSKDLRVVLFLLAQHLQNLRYCCKQTDSENTSHRLYYAQQAVEIYAPLANRLGIWQLKWEIEDLALRIREPLTYRDIAGKLNSKREEREAQLEALRHQLEQRLRDAGVQAQVQARPKHIYSIVKKMRGKQLRFEDVMDIRAMRVITPDEAACYQALALIHEWFTPVENEFDDYISKPKANGYQSIHTVVRDADAMAIEIQIRSQAMHDLAESGVAAHWAYKEAGAKGYAGVKADGEYDQKIALLRQLLLWERELSQPLHNTLLNDRIYVFTPEARIVSLTQGATPIDFAYAVHTDLGHRCRGAKVDEQIVPLNTPLQSGQQVRITAAKTGGPSQDWLNPQLGYTASNRARSKIRAWFNAEQLEHTRHKGRDMLEKLLQREGKTNTKLHTLAQQLGYDKTDTMLELIGREALPLKTVAAAFNPLEPSAEETTTEAEITASTFSSGTTTSQTTEHVCVDGLDSVLTQLAKCCRPVYPDAIAGFVTRGKGISIHRTECANYQRLKQKYPERTLPVNWNANDNHAQQFTTELVVQGDNAASITKLAMDWCGKLKIQVQSIQSNQRKGHATLHLIVSVHNREDVEKLLQSLQSEPSIDYAYRSKH